MRMREREKDDDYVDNTQNKCSWLDVDCAENNGTRYRKLMIFTIYVFATPRELDVSGDVWFLGLNKQPYFHLSVQFDFEFLSFHCAIVLR